MTCCLTSAAAVTSPCAALPYRWVEGLSPWHLHCSCHGRAFAAASRAHEGSGEVHANSRCRAGHREQECALPLCVSRPWIKNTVGAIDRSRWMGCAQASRTHVIARDRGLVGDRSEDIRAQQQMDTHDDRRDETLAFVWEFWFRVRGHAVEVLLFTLLRHRP